MDRVFGIVPAGPGVAAFLWGTGFVIGVIIIGVAVIFAMLGYQAKHTTFVLTGAGLKIGPGLYSRFIPKERIDAAGVKVVNLELEKDYLPKWRTNGAALPGLSAGWFRLANREKALLFITDKKSVVYIPTLDGYAVMASLRDADEFAGLLKRNR
ncbi:MAG: PH domain-containing protein [Dehalococcoidales bacterium]|nr:PH domain-containing protein [Dehalococcoidales bacterium]